MKTFRTMLTVALCACIGACGSDDEDPAKPTNQRPTILSVTVFPPTISPGESTIVVVNAMDPDADTLVYDWITDDRLIIKGSSGYSSLFNTYDNSHVFYHGNLSRPYPDTAWVQCFARDRRGKSDNRTVHVVLQQ
jgi:hypothetical protein